MDQDARRAELLLLEPHVQLARLDPERAKLVGAWAAGLWPVVPPERVYREDIAPYKGELELWYQRNQTLTLDLKIILLTAWVVLRPDSRLHQRWLKGLPPRPAAIK